MSIKSKRILVTGSNGFIGFHLVKRLEEEGAEVYCISKSESKKKSIRNYKLDIRNYNELNKVIKKINPNIILHLASLIDNSRDENIIKETFEVNTLGTLNLLKATKDIDYDLFIYTNTFELYGDENKPPFNEEMKTKGMSPYSTSKICGENYCELFLKIYNKPIVIFRLPIVYGPEKKGKMFIPDLMNSIKEEKEFSMTKGKQTRDFIYIKDVIDAFIMACNKNGIRGTFNIGYGKETSMRTIVKLMKKYVKLNVNFNKPYRKQEIWSYYSDISKIKKELGWEPKTSLKEGLRKTLEWWKNNE